MTNFTPEKSKQTALARLDVSPLEEIKDNYPKFLLTLDSGDGENNGIKRLNVLKWLVDK